MAADRRRVTNILMTCSGDTGTGGVQQVFRDLIRAVENEHRRVHLVYQAPSWRLWLTRGTNTWGREAFYCAMPTLVKNSALLGVLISLACLPITLFNLVHLLRREKVEAINCHYLAEYFLHLVLAGRMMRIPVIISVHGADIDRYATATVAQRFILRLVMRAAHQIVACSDAMAKQTIAVFPVARNKTTYVHNGVHLSDFPATPSSPGIDKPFLLSVSRQVVKKGTDTLVNAMALLAPKFPGLTLVIIGDGPALEDNRALARRLGLETRIAFLGDMPRTEVVRYFFACTLVVVPSRAEPFGLVVLEGAYYKKPTVCTSVGGIPEIVTDGESALFVVPNDHVAMAAKIATLLREPGFAASLGAHAHRTLVERFLWDDRVRDYIAVYERPLGCPATEREPFSAVSARPTAT